eukprot:5269839-Pyramimonas_sp.AAC.1
MASAIGLSLSTPSPPVVRPQTGPSQTKVGDIATSPETHGSDSTTYLERVDRCKDSIKDYMESTERLHQEKERIHSKLLTAQENAKKALLRLHRLLDGTAPSSPSSSKFDPPP